jgi:hypothetical protein
MLTAERLREVLRYAPETGLFYWRKDKGSRKTGAMAGNISASIGGYLQIRIDRKLYLGHRLAWLYMTGKWPDRIIDHRDGSPSNNAWPNLREATHSQNLANSRMRASMFGRGVCYHTERKRPFQGRIMKNGKSHSLGYFETAEEAQLAHRRAASKMFGEFARAQ